MVQTVEVLAEHAYEAHASCAHNHLRQQPGPRPCASINYMQSPLRTTFEALTLSSPFHVAPPTICLCGPSHLDCV